MATTPPPPLSNLGWPSATSPEFGRVWRACMLWHITSHFDSTYNQQRSTEVVLFCQSSVGRVGAGGGGVVYLGRKIYDNIITHDNAYDRRNIEN